MGWGVFLLQVVLQIFAPDISKRFTTVKRRIMNTRMGVFFTTSARWDYGDLLHQIFYYSEKTYYE